MNLSIEEDDAASRRNDYNPVVNPREFFFF